MIDKPKLLAWLDSRAEKPSKPLVQAVYAGLAERVRRGEFDDTTEPMVLPE